MTACTDANLYDYNIVGRLHVPDSGDDILACAPILSSTVIIVLVMAVPVGY